MPPPYGLLYVDCPWQYRNVKTGGSHKSGATQKYPTMSLFDLEVLPIPGIAAKDSVLALWATVPLGKDPYQLMESWGFDFKTELFWHKVGRKGIGYWLRGEVEKLLIGIRGHVPAWRHNLANWVQELHLEVRYAVESLRANVESPNFVEPLAKFGDSIEIVCDALLPREGMAGLQHPVGPHSCKPVVVRNMLLALTPGVPRVELFATDRCHGFDSYGLELDPAHDFRNPEFWKGLLAASSV